MFRVFRGPPRIIHETSAEKDSGKGRAQAGAETATAAAPAQETQAAPDAHRDATAASFQFHEHVKRVFLQRVIIGSIEFKQRLILQRSAVEFRVVEQSALIEQFVVILAPLFIECRPVVFLVGQFFDQWVILRRSEQFGVVFGFDEFERQRQFFAAGLQFQRQFVLQQPRQFFGDVVSEHADDAAGRQRPSGDAH